MQFSKCTLASIGKRPAGSETCSLGELAPLCGRLEWREYRRNWESLIGTCQQTNKQLIPTTPPDGSSCTGVMSGEFQKKKLVHLAEPDDIGSWPKLFWVVGTCQIPCREGRLASEEWWANWPRESSSDWKLSCL